MDQFINFMMNPWTITVLGGIVVVILTKLFLDRKKTPVSGISANNSQNNNQRVIINNNLNSKAASLETNNQTQTEPSIDQDILSLKAKTKILFIEDDVFKKINNLKGAGWNITQINNVENPDIEVIRSADIIFVDNKGVGQKLSNDQGLGLIKVLRQRYQNKKWLILYSAHPVGLDAFDSGADSYLTKNSAVYEIEQKIIQGAKKVVK